MVSFREVERYWLGSVSGVEWVDEETVLVATAADLYVIELATGAWKSIAPGGDHVAFSADRRRIAVHASGGRHIYVYSVPDGALIRSVERRNVRHVALSPDGRLLAWSEQADNREQHTVIVDVETGETVRTLVSSSTWRCDGVRFLADGHVTVFESTGLVEIWRGDECVHAWKHSKAVTDVQQLPSGDLLIAGEGTSAMHDARSCVWIRKLDGTEVEAPLPVGGEWVGRKQIAVALRGDAGVAATTGESCSLHLFSTADWSATAEVPTQAEGIGRMKGYRLAYSPSGDRIAVLCGTHVNGYGMGRHALLVYDGEGKLLHADGRFTHSVDHVSVGQEAVAIATEFGVDLWTSEGSRRVTRGRLQAMALSPDGRFLATGDTGYSGIVRVVDVATGETTEQKKVTKKRLRAAVFSADNEHFAVIGEHVWIHKVGRKTAVRTDKVSAIGGIAFSPDGEHFALGDKGGRLTVKSGKRFQLGYDLDVAATRISKVVWGAAFSPDGTRLAASVSGGTRIFSTADRALETIFETEENIAGPVAWSADGRFVAVGDLGGTLVVHRASDGSCVGMFEHGKKVTGVGFDAQGRLYSGSEDGSARVFEVAE